MPTKENEGLKTIFEQYDCKDEAQLYNRVKEDPESVSELVRHIEKVKDGMPEYRYICNHDYKYAEYLMTQTMPGKSEVLVTFANTANGVYSSHLIDMAGQNDLQKLLREAMKVRAIKAFLCVGGEVTSTDIRYMNALLDRFQVKAVDCIRYHSQSNLLQLANVAVPYESRPKEQMIPEDILFMEQQGYESFMKYYTQKELIGMDICEERKQVAELLKIRQQAFLVEHVESVSISSQNKILSVDTAGIGGVDYAYVDHRNIFCAALKHKEATGFIVLHNHPSGTAEGSEHDEKFTAELDTMAKALGLTMWDSLVVTRSKVVSIKRQIGLEAWLDGTLSVKKESHHCKNKKVATCHLGKSERKKERGLER